MTEEIIDWVPISSIIDLSLAAREAYTIVLVAVWSVCRIYDIPFQELLKVLEDRASTLQKARMQLDEILPITLTKLCRTSTPILTD